MISPSFHLLMKQCRSPVFRMIAFRSFTTLDKQKKDLKQQENEVLVQSSNNQIEVNTFTQKGKEILSKEKRINHLFVFFVAQQAVKETVYSLVVVAGVVALGGLCYLILHELYSRETPNGIYKEASQICLTHPDVSFIGRCNFNCIFDDLGTRSIRCTSVSAYHTTSWFYTDSSCPVID